MIRMFVRHHVSDFAAWMKAYESFDEERRGMGVKGDAVFQATHDSNDITAWHDFETLDAAQAFVASPRLREVMEQAGVSSEPSIWFTAPA